jgi:hypothetical protein
VFRIARNFGIRPSALCCWFSNRSEGSKNQQPPPLLFNVFTNKAASDFTPTSLYPLPFVPDRCRFIFSYTHSAAEAIQIRAVEYEKSR